MILSAQSIRHYGIVTPFCERTVHKGMSYGLSSCGYDVRLMGPSLHLRGNQFSLACTLEKFDMPKNIVGKVCDKSTWARQGITVQNTIIEPGWRGHLTLEIFNCSTSFRYIEQGAPIAQIIFQYLDHETEQPYSGKYQDQPDYPVPHILEK